MKHLTVDFRAPPELLADVGIIREFLELLPAVIDMTKMIDPVVVQVPDGEDSGVTGFVIIKESHISIHTYDKRPGAYVDIFSCKDFDTKLAVDFIQRRFLAYYAHVGEIERKAL